MKLYALIFTLLLGTMVLAQAQAPSPEIQAAPSPAKESKPSPTKAPDPGAADGGVSFIQALPSPSSKKPKPSTAKDPNMDPDGSVNLGAGPLENVVAEIERRIHYWTPKQESGDWVMPNVLFSQDVRDAVVPGALTLRGVSPLQALTLAAAAAGCAIEPIVATKEESDAADKPQSIIGYRIVPERKRGSGGGGFGNGTGNFIGQYSKSKESQPQMKAPDPIKTGSGDVALPVADGDARISIGKKNEYLDPRSFDGAMAVAQKDGNQRSVRIYALGSILSGTKEEIAMKQDHLRELVNEAMQKSEPEAGGSISTGRGGGGISQKLDGGTKTAPELSFHLELRALIVKGTAEQHEIIQQVMRVLNENELQQAAQPKR
jgi:hypothetical protein